jgi:hypothetical protein
MLLSMEHGWRKKSEKNIFRLSGRTASLSLALSLILYLPLPSV